MMVRLPDSSLRFKESSSCNRLTSIHRLFGKTMYGNQRYHAAHPNQGFYQPNGNAGFGHVQFNQPFPFPGMNPPHHHAQAPQRNPNWGHQNPHGQFNRPNPSSGMNQPHQQAYIPQRKPNWGYQNPHGKFNRPNPSSGMNQPHQQAYIPQRKPNWGYQNHHGQFHRPNPSPGMNPPHHQAHTHHRNPNWGHQNRHVPFNAVPPPPPHHKSSNLGHKNQHVHVNPATPRHSPYKTAPAVPPEPASPAPEMKIQDPPAPALDKKPGLKQKDFSYLFNPAYPFIPRVVEYREILKARKPVESTKPQSANQSPQLEVQDANPANVSASEDTSSSNNENDMKEEMADLKEQLMPKDVHLSELKEKRQMDKKDRQFEEQELDAKRKTLDAELEFGMSCGQEVTVLTDKLEKLNQAAEERKTEAHKLALQKLEMLKKELQEKTRYNLELTQRLKMEEEAEKDIQQEIPLVSEPEVMKDQVEADEIAEPQDFNVEPQNDPSEPEVISKQTEPEETDSIIVSQTENEEQVETEETDSIMIVTKDLEISKEPSEKEVDPPSDPKSGHQDSEEPDALLPEQTKPKKPSLWKRFKNFFTKRRSQKKQKPKI